MSVDAARLRLVDVATGVPAAYPTRARLDRAMRAARTNTTVVAPNGLHWRVRLLTLPSAMRSHPPTELLGLADPANGWTPFPLGVLVVPLALPFLPLVLLLRRVRLLPWIIEARTYPWGRRYPPVVLTYAVRGHEEAVAAIWSLPPRSPGAAAVPCCPAANACASY
jgi:hypothetical protein